MAVKFRMSEPVSVAADTLIERMCIPEEHEALSRELGATVATAERTEDGDHIFIELYVEEPERKGSGTGGTQRDRSGPE